jgi:hypothetical protein
MITQEYYLGLDLGQKKSHMAIAIVERRTDWIEFRNPVTWAMEREDVTPPRVLVRHLERVRLGTSYMDVADRVRELAWSNELRGRTKVVVDATGAGAPVVDILRRDQDLLQRACELDSVTITSGSAVRKGPKKGEWWVPKQDLITGLVLMLAEEKLEISRELPEARRLIEEVVRYGRDEGFQDDLVLALSLATWRMRAEHEDPLKDGGTKVRKGPMTAAEEFVGAIMGVPAKRFRGE